MGSVSERFIDGKSWWSTLFVGSALYVELQSRVPCIDPVELPRVLIESFEGDSPNDKLLLAMKFLMPITTASVRWVEFPKG